MNMFTTKATTRATLTESELFARFLDAPLRFGSASSLVAPKEGEEDARHYYFSFYDLDAQCLPDELPDQIIEELECSETPCSDLGDAIFSLESMLDSMRSAYNAFAALCDDTLIESPDETSPGKVFSEWLRNPRYVLPMTPADGIKRLAADNTGSNKGMEI